MSLKLSFVHLDVATLFTDVFFYPCECYLSLSIKQNLLQGLNPQLNQFKLNLFQGGLNIATNKQPCCSDKFNLQAVFQTPSPFLLFLCC